MTKARPSLSRLVLAAVASALVSIGAANAATIKLTFDPSFGSPYPDLGFSGDGLLSVADACLSNTGLITPSGTCTVTITDASVALYNLVADPLQTGTPAQTLIYAPPPLPANTVNDIVVDQLVFQNNELVALDTKIFGPQTANAITQISTGDVFPGGNVWLRFLSNFQNDSLNGGFTYDAQAVLYVGNNCNTAPTGCSESAPAEMHFSVVSPQEIPEPGTLALIAAGLGLLGLLTRGRRTP